MVLGRLPTEIIAQIVRHLPTHDAERRHPLPTSLLLVDRRLCFLAMEEQVRSLQFHTDTRLCKWLAVIDAPDDAQHCPGVARYRDMLHKIDSLELTWTSDIFERRCRSLNERLAQFVGRCCNLRNVSLFSVLEGRKDFVCQTIFRYLPSTVRSLEILYMDATVACFRAFVFKCLPRLGNLRSLTWRTSLVNITKHDVIALLTRMPPPLEDLQLDVTELSDVFDDSTLDTAMRLCPRLCNFQFPWARQVTEAKIIDWLLTRGGRPTKLSLCHRDSLSDDFFERVAPLCPLLEELILADTAGFTTRGLRAMIRHCPNLGYIELPHETCGDLLRDPVWGLFRTHRSGMFEDVVFADYERSVTFLVATDIQELRHFLENVWDVLMLDA